MLDRFHGIGKTFEVVSEETHESKRFAYCRASCMKESVIQSFITASTKREPTVVVNVVIR